MLYFVFQNEYHIRHPQGSSPAKIQEVVAYINYSVEMTIVAILCYIYRVSFDTMFDRMLLFLWSPWCPCFELLVITTLGFNSRMDKDVTSDDLFYPFTQSVVSGSWTIAAWFIFFSFFLFLDASVTYVCVKRLQWKGLFLQELIVLISFCRRKTMVFTVRP